MFAKLIWFVVLTPVIYAGIAGLLILSQWPSALKSREGGLDFSATLSAKNVTPREPEAVEMRDGTLLPVRLYGTRNPDPLLMPVPLLVMVHGSGWHGMQFDGLARSLSDRALVAVPDLRGHGAAPVHRGDIAHVGQYEEDLADLIGALRQDGQKIIVAGHSSGGGLVVRMAGGPYRNHMDQAVLLAPFLKHSAPTIT